MARALAKKAETSTTLLEAAKKVLRQNGYSGLSTRDVAAAAGVPLSQIHYHFGSKQGMVLALFEYLNAQLLDRQNAMFGDTTLKLSQQWDRACDYLDEDIASGYVRVLQELIAASWADPEVAKVVRAGLMGWVDLIVDVARKAETGARRAWPVHARGGRRLRRQRLHRRRKASICSASRRKARRCASRCGASATSFASRKALHRRGDAMRAKLPDKEGFVERDGVKIHYEVYGDGPQTMVFLPPWSIVHSRDLQGADAVFQRALPLHRLRRPRQRQVRPPGGRGGLLAGQLRGRRARRHGCDRGGQGHPGRPVLRRPARLRARRASSRAREGRDPGRDRGEHRTRQLPLSGEQAFRSPSRSGSRAGTSTTASTGWRIIPTSPSTSSATSIPSRTRPSRSRTASTGPATPAVPCWSRPSKHGRSRRSFDVSEAMYRKIRCPVLVIHGDDDQIQPCARAKAVAEVTGAELVTIPGGGHNPLGRIPAKCNALIVDFLDRRLGIAAPGRAVEPHAPQGQARALSLLADRPRPRPARHRHRARIAQAASRPARSTGWRRIR